MSGPADGEGVQNPFDAQHRIRAVLFDLDGTLYRQMPLRVLMAIELATLAVRHPVAAPRRLRALKEYRKAQEALRGSPSTVPAPNRQLELAAKQAGIPVLEMKMLADEWMVNRPLKYLSLCRQRGLEALLAFLDDRRVRMGILSDYPATGKLEALKLGGRFSPVLCADDREVGALKPDPRGFLLACQRWRLAPQDVLMVGDRIEVDAAGAAAAGMPCVIIGRPSRSASDRSLLAILPSLERLHRVLADGR